MQLCADAQQSEAAQGTQSIAGAGGWPEMGMARTEKQVRANSKVPGKWACKENDDLLRRLPFIELICCPHGPGAL